MIIAWASIAQMTPKGKRRGSQAAVRLAEAYQAVFMGTPTKTDQQLVMADLAAASLFFATPGMEASDAELRHVAGARELYGRIHSNVTLTDEQALALMQAARTEIAAQQQEDDA